MRIRDLFEDFGQGMLDERIRMQLDHGMHTHALDYIVEITLVVVNDAPAKTPAGKTVDFGDGASADDGHGSRSLTERNEGTLGVIGQSVVDFISDDGHLEFIRDSQNLLHVLGREAGAARVARIVDEDGFGARRNLAAQVSQVDLPTLLGHEAVRLVFYVQILANRCD